MNLNWLQKPYIWFNMIKSGIYYDDKFYIAIIKKNFQHITIYLISLTNIIDNQIIMYFQQNINDNLKIIYESFYNRFKLYDNDCIYLYNNYEQISSRFCINYNTKELMYYQKIYKPDYYKNTKCIYLIDNKEYNLGNLYNYEIIADIVNHNVYIKIYCSDTFQLITETELEFISLKKFINIFKKCPIDYIKINMKLINKNIISNISYISN